MYAQQKTMAMTNISIEEFCCEFNHRDRPKTLLIGQKSKTEVFDLLFTSTLSLYFKI